MGPLYVNRKKVPEGGIDHTQPIFFSADETADAGIDLATPVVEPIGAEGKSRFTGGIPKVKVEVKESPKKSTHRHPAVGALNQSPSKSGN